MDMVSETRRRGRGGVPAPRTSPYASQPAPGEDGVDYVSDQLKADWITSLKELWGRLLDHIEEVMMSGDSKVSPRGNVDTETVMQLWGKVTWPIVFLTKLKSASTGARGPLDEADISMLRRSIDHAVQSERELNNELRINISLSDAYDTVLKSFGKHSEYHPSFYFDKAVALLAVAIDDMQKGTGIYFEDSFLQEFTSLPVLGHLSVSSVASVGGADLCSHGCGSSPESSTGSEPTKSDTNNEYTVGNTRFTKSGVPADLVVVSLQHCAMSTDLMHHVYHETSAALHSPSAESVANIARGVIFSDTEMGVACLAVSVLSDLGAELDDSGSRLVIRETSSFFDDTFAGGLSPSALIATGMPSNIPWDAAPDLALGFEW